MQSYEKMSKLLAFERIFYAKFKLFLYIKCLFPTWRRNLSYVLTQKLLRRHVISRALEEKKSLATTRVARDSHHPLIYLYLKDLLKIRGPIRNGIQQSCLASSSRSIHCPEPVHLILQEQPHFYCLSCFLPEYRRHGERLPYLGSTS